MRFAVFALVSMLFSGLLLIVKTAESKRSAPERHLSYPLKPQVVRAAASGVSPAVKDLGKRSIIPRQRGSAPPPAILEKHAFHSASNPPPPAVHDADGASAKFSGPPMPNSLLSFDGLSNFDNIAAYNLLIIPPDTIGDVGPNHYVQAVNALVRVFDKNGNAVTNPFKMSQLFAPIGTPCATRNDGSPNVLYDPLADRWLLSQYCTAFPPFRQMIAVSRTGDPTGEYFIYEFVMPNVKLNDSSKLAVWPDAYYMSTDEFFGADFAGSGAFAFERSKMLAGDATASYIYFNLPSSSVVRLGNLLPADLDGLRVPPPGSPNIFSGYTATEYGNAQDAIRLFDFVANFADPQKSSFTERPESPIPVAAFDPTSPEGRADIAQPPPGERLDSQSDRLMYRVAYRNFGTHESLVFNQTVRLSPAAPYRAGVRLYELQRHGSGPFVVHEQATAGSLDSSRWIGSAAQDHQGNIAVGYNYVNEMKVPSVLYTGKLVSETSGALRPEGTLINGTGVQKAFGYRWGDYSGLSVDPADDCSFWLTSQYYTLASQEFHDFAWLTRIGKFKFSECIPTPRASITGNVLSSLTGDPILTAKVTASGYSRHTNAGGSYGEMAVLPGQYEMTASAEGYLSQSFSVLVADGETRTQNFSLAPIPVVESTETQITAESCGLNGAAEPGETVTINISLQNVGALGAQNVTATLMPSGGVINPGPPQNFGSLPAGGESVSRPFTFTVAPHLQCGSIVTMEFLLEGDLGFSATLYLDLQTGYPRIALRESFDRLFGPKLPQRWTTAAAGAQQIWRNSSARAYSGRFSAFTPAPRQPGVNELVSPVFRISSEEAYLSFRNWYTFETTFLRNVLYDGSVLEIRIGGGDWTDILAAGGFFETGGYDGPLDDCCENPLAGRLAWSGRSGVNQTAEFINTKVRLPSNAAGQDVQLRWRAGTDNGTFREGQYIDDVIISDGYACTCTSDLMNQFELPSRVNQLGNDLLK